uniref:arginine--tRNA ligase n=1 Tax=Octactis speculum TaxID=3111310 RepID=A0A7S2DLK4_9STRA
MSNVFYNPLLPGMIEDLGELKETLDNGALCVMLEGFDSRDGGAQPLIVRKGDGGFMYASTDLAAIRQRVTEEKADRVLYVTDIGQSTHFEQVFQVARRAGFVPSSVKLEHVPFGLVQGEDGKKFKTRAGDTVKLKDLLDEAVSMASKDIRGRSEATSEEAGETAAAAGETADSSGGGGGVANTDYLDDSAAELAKTIGIGAVKYADLSLNRESNYRFSYNKMLALNGNTAPYMLYAYARIQGIRRRSSESLDVDITDAPIILEHDAERALARQLLRFPEVLQRLERDLYPNQLCDFLFETSQKFNQFYENCPVINAETDELRASRTALCATTAQLLQKSLELLGIGVVDRL